MTRCGSWMMLIDVGCAYVSVSVSEFLGESRFDRIYEGVIRLAYCDPRLPYLLTLRTPS